MDRLYNVLFLCSGNSARSIMAESLLNYWGRGRFRAFSAGSFPTGRVNPHALALLERMHMPAAGARSKSWNEFAAAGAPALDFVFTVCDNAANEACPVWPGRPMTAHWGIEDPAAVTGTELEISNAFRHAFDALEHRIRIFVSLPIASLEQLKLQQHLEGIGRSRPPAVGA